MNDDDYAAIAREWEARRRLRARWVPLFCLVNGAIALAAGYVLMFVLPVGFA